MTDLLASSGKTTYCQQLPDLSSCILSAGLSDTWSEDWCGGAWPQHDHNMTALRESLSPWGQHTITDWNQGNLFSDKSVTNNVHTFNFLFFNLVWESHRNVHVIPFYIIPVVEIKQRFSTAQWIYGSRVGKHFEELVKVSQQEERGFHWPTSSNQNVIMGYK